MDFDESATLEAGPAGGLLRDLGSHLVDQMLWLLGPVASVDAQLDQVALPEGPTDASFTLTLRHRSGAHSHISASKVNYLTMRELRAYGDKGSYVASGSDVQAQSIFAGKRPADDLRGWGYEPEANWGVLRTAAGEERVPAEQGRYHDYYEAFARAVRTGGRPPCRPKKASRRSPSSTPPASAPPRGGPSISDPGATAEISPPTPGGGRLPLAAQPTWSRAATTVTRKDARFAITGSPV